jgi:ribonucleoside-diphosphate reductase beta chain
MSVKIFNIENTEWKTGENSLILGQYPGLFDTVNKKHDSLFKIFKGQKAADWSENEVDLASVPQQLSIAPTAIKELLWINLTYQWSGDTVASRTIVPLLAPFITNTELWRALYRNGEMENTHAATYSEIVRLCLPNANEIFEMIQQNKHITKRLDVVLEHLEDLRIAGHQYGLDIIQNDQVLYNRIMLACTAFYLLEQVQFMASFSATFALAENDWFIPVAQLVQKIAFDESQFHATLFAEFFRIELQTPRGKQFLLEHKATVQSLIAACEQTELDFNAYLFSEGRQLVGVNEELNNAWVVYCSHKVKKTFGLVQGIPEPKLPFNFIKNWLDINKTQSSPQEQDITNYVNLTLINDLDDDEDFSF